MNKLQILAFIAFLESVPIFMEVGFVHPGGERHPPTFGMSLHCYTTLLPIISAHHTNTGKLA